MVLQITIVVAPQPFPAPLLVVPFSTSALAPFLDLPTPLLPATFVWVETYKNSNMVSMHAQQTKWQNIGNLQIISTMYII